MASIRKEILDQVEKLPGILLRERLSEKLHEQGLEDPKLLDALTDHILNCPERVFSWNDGKTNEHKHVTIALTKKDQDEIHRRVASFIKNDLPSVTEKLIDEFAKSSVKNLEKRWPERKIDDLSDQSYFRARIDLRWAPGLDPLRMLLISSREVGQDFSARLERSKAKKGTTKRGVLAILHLRANQTALEILLLLENGFADGADARWRTLYELSVVAYIIDRFDDDLAERFLAHEVVSAREAMENQARYAGEIFDPNTLKGEDRKIELEYQRCVTHYGKSFKGPYGWCAKHLEHKSPRLADLERGVDWKALSPNYKRSSFKVHAGAAGALGGIGMMEGWQGVHGGASNWGLDIPAINTAHTMVQITSLVLPTRDNLELTAQMNMLLLLRERVEAGCRRAVREIRKAESEYHRQQRL